MARNRLAPAPNNALAYSVPQPYVPGTLPDPRAVYSPYRNLENLSIGLGRGIRSSLEGTKQLITQPVATAQALLQAAREIGEDPMVVLQMLNEARRKAMSGTLGLGELIGENVTPGMRARRPTMQEIDVYHGTPHRFEPTPANPLGEFDARKIGTGEGAQAYGHGTYLAESPKVAKEYATYIPYRNLVRKIAQVYDEFDSPAEAEQALAKAGLTPAQMRVMQALKEDDYLGFDYPHQALEAALKNPEYFDLSPKTKEALSEISSLYKADLPDEMVDRMLDYDKPLKEQPANVQKFFSRIYKPDDYLTDWLKQGDPDSVAEILQQEGIPGIKYRDARSRRQGGTGTRNFVVFPGEEKKVRIFERK